jgi:hypothetical protein
LTATFIIVIGYMIGGRIFRPARSWTYGGRAAAVVTPRTMSWMRARQPWS